MSFMVATGQPPWWRSLALAMHDAIVVVDHTRTVCEGNSAAARILGLPLDELIGASAADVLGIGGLELLVADSASAGPIRQPVPGTESGLLAMTVPVPDGWLVLVRDISDLSAVAAVDPQRLDDDRSALLSVMDQVMPADDLQQTVTTLCEALQKLDWVDGAMIFLLPGSGDLINVTTDMPPELDMDFGASFGEGRLDDILAATEKGPWYLNLTGHTHPDFIDKTLLEAMRNLGIRASAYAAIRTEGRLFGVLSVASFAEDAASLLAGRLGSLQDLARLSGAILRNQAMIHSRTMRLRSQIRSTIDNHAFWPVFQPIVTLPERRIVGYEALTRFADGRDPQTHFAEATEVGMEVELEEVCARAALIAAQAAPFDISIGLNFSPRAVVDGALHRLGDLDRSVVVEITEHTRTTDYELLRHALRAAPPIEVAVDDAGAGYASLRHVLELQPQYVKLDIGLIRDVDRDPARAAMVAGMRHFATATGARLVAEGVERPEQAAVLEELGVCLAQGYLFGHPHRWDGDVPGP